MAWRKRKLELLLAIVIVAVLALFVRPGPTLEPSEPSPRAVNPPSLQLPQARFSEDARWLLETAADSYSPRVPVEKVLDSRAAPKQLRTPQTH